MAKRDKLDRDGLARKIRWEGGVAAALDYGIRPSDIADPGLAALWARLYRSHTRMAPLVDKVCDLLDVAA